MCFSKPKIPGPQPIAAYDNQEANRQATLEAQLRRRRRGAAADVLTSPVGIPSGSTATLGGVA